MECDKQKLLVELEINKLDDVQPFCLRYFKTYDGTHYLFMKILNMLIDDNRQLHKKIEELESLKRTNK